MKLIFSTFTLAFLLSIVQLKAQNYHKQFSPINEQPGLDSFVSYGDNDDYIYMLSRVRKSGGVDSATLRYYNGSSWFNAAPFKYKGKGGRILYHLGEYYVSGTFKELNGIAAPSGRYYSLIRLKGNAWDTVGGSSLPDSVKYRMAHCNDEAIYIMNEVSKQLTNIFLFKKNTGFTNTYKVVTSFPSYGGLSASARGKLFFAYAGLGGSISTVNGTGVYGEFLIKNGVVSTPSLGSGDIIGASVNFKDEIVYFKDNGPLMQLYDGTTSKNLETNLKNKYFGGVPPFPTHNDLLMPGGTLNGANAVFILAKDSTNWADLPIGNYGYGLLYSKSLGIFSFNLKTLAFKRLELGGTIEGRTYLDDDSSCNYDTTELLLGRQVLSFMGTNGNFYAMTDEKGFYSTTSGKDILSIESKNKYTNISPCILVPDTIKPGSYKYRDIPLHHSHAPDLEGRFAASFRARLGDSVSLKVVVMNNGISKRNARVRLRIPSEVDLVSSSPTATVSGKILEWNISDLKAFQHKSFSIRVGINNTKLKIGDDICYYLRVDTFSTEKDTFNNLDTLCQHIVGSYDPNSKESSPSGDITFSPKKIDYVIHFQNLGTDYARHVVIRDTLTGLLDIASLQILESSHPCKIRLENNVLIVSFNDIMLDYSSRNEAASKGWVAFSIGVRGGLKPATVVKNRAYIYFDYNPAIVTNDALLTLVVGSGIKEQQKSSTILYPNPASSLLNIDNLDPQNHNIRIYNMQGVLVRSIDTEGQSSIQLDIREWSTGIYFIRTDTQIIKMIKID